MEKRLSEVERHQTRMQEEIVGVARDSAESNEHLMRKVEDLEGWIKDTHSMVKELHKNGNGKGKH